MTFHTKKDGDIDSFYKSQFYFWNHEEFVFRHRLFQTFLQFVFLSVWRRRTATLYLFFFLRQPPIRKLRAKLFNQGRLSEGRSWKSLDSRDGKFFKPAWKLGAETSELFIFEINPDQKVARKTVQPIQIIRRTIARPPRYQRRYTTRDSTNVWFLKSASRRRTGMLHLFIFFWSTPVDKKVAREKLLNQFRLAESRSWKYLNIRDYIREDFDISRGKHNREIEFRRPRVLFQDLKARRTWDFSNHLFRYDTFLTFIMKTHPKKNYFPI